METGAGETVKNPNQAVTIALSEAGLSKYESEKQNKRDFRRTKEKENKGERSRHRKKR